MNIPTLNCARALRDGGIDAVAALDAALRIALEAISPADQQQIKLAIGRAMSAVLDETVNVAVSAFPELNPDQATWAAVVKARVNARAVG